MTNSDQAASAIEEGRLIVVPTDTVYGVGCDPYQPEAVADLLGTKGRGKTMPPPVLAADKVQALSLADWGLLTNGSREFVERLADAYWPGALTLIVPTSRTFGWDMQTYGQTVAVRVPDQKLTRDLLRKTGPLAVTSANLTGQPPALTVDAARRYFGDLVAYYLDGGTARGGEASTIIDCTSETPRVIRAGALSSDDILRHYNGEKPADF